MRKKKSEDLPLLFDLTPFQKQQHPDEIDIEGEPDLPPPHPKKVSPVISPVASEDQPDPALEIGTSVRHAHRDYIGTGTIYSVEEIDRQRSPGKLWYQVAWATEREQPGMRYLSSELIPLPTGETTGEKIYQWLEIYQRHNKQYYRYCYSTTEISPTKKIHIPGGNIGTALAMQRKTAVEVAIANGKSPIEIIALISCWQRRG